MIIPGHGPNLADLVIIDTAPKSESAALVAARLADLILTPASRRASTSMRSPTPSTSRPWPAPLPALC
ncbi:MAG: hypothetical protein ABL908_07255 [Hyphomicrobium sp.]